MHEETRISRVEMVTQLTFPDLPLLLDLNQVPLLLWDVPISTFFSEVSALVEKQREPASAGGTDRET
jgi:hypothetical protein